MTPLPHKLARIYGWGRVASLKAKCLRPERRQELSQLPEGSAIARGLGRSYGDASFNADCTVLTTRLNRMLAFDEARGVLTAEAGVSLAEIMEVLTPRGWLPPVLPGTKFVTLGGALAGNVHGKNHHIHGDFAEHVDSIVLLLADGSRVTCSAQRDAELFWATAGGMGMTGMIEQVTLRLRPIHSSSMSTLRQRTESIGEMIELFEKHRDASEYLVGWIDHSAKHGELGRGIFEAAVHAEEGTPLEAYRPERVRWSVPCVMPSWLLNRWSMALYNRLRFRGIDGVPKISLRSFADFFHPLDGIGDWNKLYGRRGFFQYQCVLPEHPQIAQHLEELLAHIHARGLFSFLAVLKCHRESVGMMSFPMRGYSLALDFPNTKKVRALVQELNRWVAERGGRVYLAKDATLERHEFERMYAHTLPAWRAVLRRVDPQRRWRSAMSERLGFHA